MAMLERVLPMLYRNVPRIRRRRSRPPALMGTDSL